jgi:glycosyltransferase involved in cell wall biosynthesis
MGFDCGPIDRGLSGFIRIVSARAQTRPAPLRVLMITPDHLMIDRRILQEALTLKGAGYEIEILAGFECPQPIVYDKDGVSVRRFRFDWTDPRVDWILPLFAWMPGRLRAVSLRISRRTVALLTGLSSFESFVLRQILAASYDILHCHDYPLLGVAVAAKRRRPAPLVYDAHELYHAQSILPKKTRERYRRRERRLIRHVDLAITVNDFIARAMADDYGHPKPEVLLNAAPRQSKAVREAGLRERLKFSPSDQIILYQGWISPERGIESLVRAARHFPPDVHLVVIGYGDYDRTLRRLSAEQGTDDGRVIFFGGVDSDDLPPLTRSADIGIIPYQGVDLNHYYSSPNKLFEYAVAGLPFVCNDLPFMRWIIDRYGFGVVADLSKPEEAATEILAILNDPKRLHDLKNSAQTASGELNWELEGAKLVSLYENVVIPKLAAMKSRPPVR